MHAYGYMALISQLDVDVGIAVGGPWDFLPSTCTSLFYPHKDSNAGLLRGGWWRGEEAQRRSGSRAGGRQGPRQISTTVLGPGPVTASPLMISRWSYASLNPNPYLKRFW